MLESSKTVAPPTSVTRLRLSPFTFLRRRRNVLALLTELSRNDGDLVKIRVGGQTIVLLKHPDFIQQTLVADASLVEKGRTAERELFFAFLGDGLLNARGESHRRQRRLMLPGFHRQRLRTYASTMASEAALAANQWSDGEVRNAHADMMSVALRIVGRTLFSSDITSASDVISGGFAELAESMNRLVFPGARLLLRTPLPFARKLRARQQALDATVYDLIARRRAEGLDQGDLLSMLLLAEDAEHPGERLSDVEVRDEIMTILFTGQAPIGDTLAWALWLLAQHPEKQAALAAEAAALLGDREPTMEDLPLLPAADRIIRETLRLYPPLWILGRRAVRSFSYGTEPVDAGTLLLTSQWINHRNERWFSRPDQFEPDRWTSEFRGSLPRYAYFPFGGGARSCIGENFAWMELVLVLTTLVRQWHFSLVPQSEALQPLARITLHPDRPVLLRLQRRSPS